MSTLFCACRSSYELSTETATIFALGTYNGQILQWAIWLDLARRFVSVSRLRKTSSVLYYGLFFFLWPFMVFVQPLVAVYAPNGEQFLSEQCCPFAAANAACTCFAQASLFFNAVNVWAVPDLFTVTVVPYFLIHLYLDRKARYATAWNSAVYAFMLLYYTVSELALGRKTPVHMSVNFALALVVTLVFLLLCRVIQLKPTTPPPPSNKKLA